MQEANAFISPFELITHKAKQFSKNVALYWYSEKGRESLTYQQLMQQVDILSALFKMKPGSLVALILPRRAEFIIALLAIWKAGLVFVPFDPKWGENDIANRIRHLQIDMIITTETFSKSDFKLSEFSHKIFVIDGKTNDNNTNNNTNCTSNDISPKPLDLAYIYASSGTSGQPKMIEIPYEGIVPRIEGIINKMSIVPSDVVLSSCSFGFDASLCEILMAFISGASLMIAPEYVRGDFYNKLPDFLFSSNPKPTVSIFIPKMLNQIDGVNRKIEEYPNIKKILITGEKSQRKNLDYLLSKDIRIFNGYGPTETTIGATLTEIHKHDKEIGLQDQSMGLKLTRIKPEAGKKIIIPANKEGEGIICISGKGIGRYRNNEEKNKLVFLDAAQAKELGFPEERVFITDDLVELKDGQLIFKNRVDRIIKPNGVQVDLDEVEKRLDSIIGKCPGLLKHIVLAEADYILSYSFVDNNFDTNKYREQLKQISFSTSERPSYYFTIKSNQWGNKNGKTIRNINDIYKNENLTPNQLNAKLYDSLDEQETEIEKIWRDILLSDIRKEIRDGITLNHDTPFDELGGASLTMGEMISKVWNKYLIRAKNQNRRWLDFYDHAFRHSTIRGISSYFKIISNIHYKAIQTSQYPLHIVCLCTSIEDVDKFISNEKKISEFSIHMIMLDNILITEMKNRIADPKYILSILREIDTLILEQGVIDPYYFKILNTDLEICKHILQEYFIKEKNKLTYFIDGPVNKEINSAQFTNWIKLLNLEINKKNKMTFNNKNPTINLDVTGLKSSTDIEDKLKSYFTIEQYRWLRVNRLTLIIENIEFMNRERPLTIKKIVEYFEKIAIARWSLKLGINKEINISAPFLNEENISAENRAKRLYFWFEKMYEYYGLSSQESMENEMIILDEFGKFLDSINSIISNYCDLSGCVDITEKKSQWEIAQSIPNIWSLHYFNWIRLLFKEVTDDSTSLLYVPRVLLADGMTPYTNFLKDAKQYALSREPSQVNNFPFEIINLSDPEKESFQIIAKGRYPIPLILFAPLTGNTPEGYHKIASYLHEQTLYALSLSHKGSNGQDRKLNLSDKVDYYVKLIYKIQPKGPYLLLGWSFGAIIAFEVALRLEAKGEKVLQVFNLDCPPAYKIEQTDKIGFVKSLIVELGKIYKAKEPEEINKILDETNSDEAENLFENVISYLQHDTQNKKFINALYNARINYPAYFEFAKLSKTIKLMASYHIFIAEEKHRYINENVFFEKWNEYLKEPAKTILTIPGNHFTIFTPTLFDHIRRIIWQVQDIDPNLKRKPLSILEYVDKYKGDITTYVPPSVSMLPESNTIYNLDEICENFLGNSKSLFLLQGPPGIGKTFVSKYILSKLIKLFINNSNAYLPFFVNLAEKNPVNIRNIIEDYQLDYESIINKKIQIFLIYDGLDESKNKMDEKFIKECLDNGAKIWVTCREDHVYSEDLKNSYKHQLDNYHLLPFNDQQLENFCNCNNINFVEFKKEFLSTSFLSILRIPLFLSLFMKQLQSSWSPELEYSSHAVESLLYIVDKETFALYKNQGALRKGVNYIQACLNYLASAAYCVWSKKDESIHLSKDKDTHMMRLLGKIEIRNNKIYFPHNLFYEFYLAKYLLSVLSSTDPTTISSRYKIWGAGNLLSMPKTLEFLKQDLSQSALAVPNNTPVPEYRIKTLDKKIPLIQSLFAFVWNSVQGIVKNTELEEKILLERAAANAISLLNLLGVNFSGLNLRGIRIPGGSLKSALAQGTDFEDADLAGVNLENAYISQANFTDANLNSIDLGLKYCAKIGPLNIFDAFAISENNSCLATLKTNEIELWNLKTGDRDQIIPLTLGSALYESIGMRFSSDQLYLAVLIENTFYLYIQRDEQYSFREKWLFQSNCDYKGINISFSFDNMYLIAAGILSSHNNTKNKILVKIWKWASQNNTYVFVKDYELDCATEYYELKTIRLNFKTQNEFLVGYAKNLYFVDLLNDRVMCYDCEGFSNNLDYCLINNSLFFADVMDAGVYNDQISVINNNTVISLLEKTDVDKIYEIKFSQTGKLVGASTTDRKLYVWDTFTGKLLQTIPLHDTDIYQFTFSADDELILYASLSCTAGINLKIISANIFNKNITVNQVHIGNKAQNFIIEKVLDVKKKSYEISNLFTQNKIALLDSDCMLTMHPHYPLIIYYGEKQLYICNYAETNTTVVYKTNNAIPIFTQDGLIFLCLADVFTTVGGWTVYNIRKIEKILHVIDSQCISDITITNNHLFITPKKDEEVLQSRREEGFRYIQSLGLMIEIIKYNRNSSIKILLLSQTGIVQHIDIDKYRQHIFNKKASCLVILQSYNVTIYELVSNNLGEYNLKVTNKIDMLCSNVIIHNQSNCIGFVDEKNHHLVRFNAKLNIDLKINLSEKANTIHAICLNHDENILAISYKVGLVEIRNVEDYKIIDTIYLINKGAYATLELYFTPQNDLVVIDRHNKIYHWRYNSAEKIFWSLHYVTGSSLELMSNYTILPTKISQQDAKNLLDRGAIQSKAAILATANDNKNQCIHSMPLPILILEMIFLSIGYRERAHLSRVCKEWCWLLSKPAFFRLTTNEIEAIQLDLIRFCQQVFHFERDASIFLPPHASNTTSGECSFFVQNNEEQHTLTYSMQHLKTIGFFSKAHQPILKTPPVLQIWMTK